MSENLKVDIDLGILNLSQKRGYKVFSYDSEVFVYLTFGICVQNSTVLLLKWNIFLLGFYKKKFLNFLLNLFLFGLL